ncbi:P-loop NTPase family protein [Dinghuibacter silviterrae]|uniref:Thymidylate kinase n=1 Tax=Dinghuibacter silviterrae TaxID=1539049 RepID=A0A4R8DRR0_9BACT|nr:hypothetical protein [Dinghuibacter silviterrae]TDW99830.1 hypothetical protein EDB95_0844 [Dinghuibacter silviterrae]
MNTHILLVEGTSGTGKSSLIRRLLDRHVLEDERPRTLFHLSQAHTYFPLASPDLDTVPGKRACREHLRRLLRVIDISAPPLQPRRWFTVFGLIDTLHLTQAFRPGILSWAELSYIDQYLSGREVRMVFLKAAPETLWQRLIVDRGAAPEYLSHYQHRYGGTAEEVHAYYVREQSEMERLASRSRLSTLILDERQGMEEEVYRFWKAE